MALAPLPPDLARALAAADVRVATADTRYYSDIDSTNDTAVSLAEAGAPDGTVVLADQQRRGRGRRGRTWYSPAGAGLYVSRVIRLANAGGASGLVTLGVGVAVARAVRSTTGLPVELKWPNDVVTGRPWRKLGGVLCETVGAGSRVDAIVAGVGLNLQASTYPAEVGDRATSVEAELGRTVERAPLVAALLTELADLVGVLDRGDASWVCGEWRELGAAGLGGAPVRWREAGVERTGLARDIDRDGRLVVDSDGRTDRLIAGEVTWERVSHVRR